VRSKAPFAVTLFALLLLTGAIVIQGECVQEDAFISFRYAANLLDGHGLTWNPGERVEGYTNFLWTVILAGAMALGADPATAARVLGILAAAVLFWTVLWAAHRYYPGGKWTGPLAVLLLAATPGFSAEAIQGLETIWFALLVTVAVTATLDALASSDPARRRSRFARVGFILALAALTRPEGVGVLGLIVLGSFIASRRGASTWRPLLIAVGVFLVIYVPYWWLRFDYYGYPLPNTFYAKTGGGLHHLLRGLGYLGRFLLHHPVLAVMTVAAFSALKARLTDRRRPQLMVPFIVTFGYLAYVAVVGGDFKATWRFILPVLPMWILMVTAWVEERLVRVGVPDKKVTGPNLVWIMLVAAALNAAPTLTDTLRWSRQRARDLERRTVCGEWLRDNAPSDAVVAIHSAGIIPYVSGLYAIDMWGLNDLHIAHRTMPDMGRAHGPGHEKFDYAYVLGRNPRYIMPRGWAMVTSEPFRGVKASVFEDFGDVTDTEGVYVERHVPLPPGEDGGPRWFNFLESSALSSPQ